MANIKEIETFNNTNTLKLLVYAACVVFKYCRWYLL